MYVLISHILLLLLQDSSTAALKKKQAVESCAIQGCIEAGIGSCKTKSCEIFTTKRKICSTHGGKHANHASKLLKQLVTAVPSTASQQQASDTDGVVPDSEEESTTSSAVPAENNNNIPLVDNTCCVSECNGVVIETCGECNARVCDMHGPSHENHRSQLRKESV